MNKPSKPNDESSSTHQLAESDDGNGHDGKGSSDFEAHAMDRFRPGGNQYTSTVTGHRSNSGGGEYGANFGGILVKNETTVHVSKQ